MTGPLTIIDAVKLYEDDPIRRVFIAVILQAMRDKDHRYLNSEDFVTHLQLLGFDEDKWVSYVQESIPDV